MDEVKQNYYGSLCSDMYEILHKQAPQDELNFYLSYAEKGGKILEPLCGSGRFLIPFLERGFDIYGIDLSKEMLDKLIQKAPNAQIIHSDIANYTVQENFDYIFIPSGSISLFTDMRMCKSILQKMKNLLTVGGKFVFAVDTLFGRRDDNMYKVCASVKTKEGYELILKMKNHYDEDSQTQFSPSVYELYNGTELLKSENMDFQTHLYRYGEMEEYLMLSLFLFLSGRQNNQALAVMQVFFSYSFDPLNKRAIVINKTKRTSPFGRARLLLCFVSCGSAYRDRS